MNPACTVLFVTNGHGEVAIAARIASAFPASFACDHLALVGDVTAGPPLREIGPRRALPSGGLIAMGNLRNIARDLAGGLLVHTLAQMRFLRSVRGTYDVCVAVGDVFALLMTLRAQGRKSVFAGTAKSVLVAPYGPMEERAIARADAVFVRDDPTVQRLRDHGIAANAANVIVDLYSGGGRNAQAPAHADIAIFPGSRAQAYHDAVRLCGIVRELARLRPGLTATLSVAPGVDAAHLARALSAGGWDVQRSLAPETPFTLRLDGNDAVRAWCGPLDALLDATVVLGQAGTANEAAAAAGIPVVAYEETARASWYRRRQIGLLGDALMVVRGTQHHAAAQVAALLDDAPRRAAMGAAGRERMGRPGGAALIAAEIERLCN